LIIRFLYFFYVGTPYLRIRAGFTIKVIKVIKVKKEVKKLEKLFNIKGEEVCLIED